MNIIKIIKNESGLTLIEIIISIVLLGIIIIAFLGIFTTGFKGIMSAGRNSQAGYIGQKAMENRIVDLPVSEPSVTTRTESGETININFDGVGNVAVDGKIEIIHYDDASYKIDFATFIPD